MLRSKFFFNILASNHYVRILLFKQEENEMKILKTVG